jgi:DNA-directed RNA polymerase specialized sigma24 family protein
LAVDDAEADREVRPDEEEVLLALAVADEDVLARLRDVVRRTPEVYFRRGWSLEELAQILGASPDKLRTTAETGRLRGTYGPLGWTFGPADVYPLLFPDEGHQP